MAAGKLEGCNFLRQAEGGEGTFSVINGRAGPWLGRDLGAEVLGKEARATGVLGSCRRWSAAGGDGESEAASNKAYRNYAVLESHGCK